MHRYRLIYLLIHLAIASASYFLVTNLEMVKSLIPGWPYAVANYPVLENVFALGIISLIAILFQQSNRLANILVEQLPISPLIRRLASGRDFIEGDWPLVVVDGTSGALRYLGFLTITFHDSELYVFGEDWTPDGVHAHKFASVRSRLQADHKERLLQYFYVQGASSQETRMRGYTEIYFLPTYRKSERLAGEFRDAEHNNVRFYAIRTRYRPWDRRLRSKEARLGAAKAVWAALEPQINAMIREPVSADWV